MPGAVRVIGRVDRAEEVCRALRGAGTDAQPSTASPVTAFFAESPPDGLDVVVATSAFNPPLWSHAKRRRPTRPMVAIAERRRERVLRGAVHRRHGPDSYVARPAFSADLEDAVKRAVASAGRPRRWGLPDIATPVAWIGVPFAWNVRPRAFGGVLFTVLGASLLVLGGS